MPAQSPTLSPTLSAMVAGLRGSSSGMPASTLPTRSAPDVGGLGEDAAADAEEQREERTAEAEADEDGRRGVLEDGDDGRRAEQTEADGEHAGDATGAEGDLQGVGQRVALRRCGRADIAAGRQGHADVAGETGHQPADHEGRGPGEAGHGDGQGDLPAGLLDLGGGDEHDDRERDEDHPDRAELALEVGPGALLDRGGDLDHLRRALVGCEHVSHQHEADSDGEQRRRTGKGEDRPFAAVQRKDLISALGGNQHRVQSSSPASGRSPRWRVVHVVSHGPCGTSPTARAPANCSARRFRVRRREIDLAGTVSGGRLRAPSPGSARGGTDRRSGDGRRKITGRQAAPGRSSRGSR